MTIPTLIRQAADILSVTDFALASSLFRAACDVERMELTLNEIAADAAEDEAIAASLPVVRRTRNGRGVLRVVG